VLRLEEPGRVVERRWALDRDDRLNGRSTVAGDAARRVRAREEDIGGSRQESSALPTKKASSYQEVQRTLFSDCRPYAAQSGVRVIVVSTRVGVPSGRMVV
jgi:hypothetical protein